MRNFKVTVDGKAYEVAVEEISASSARGISAPVVSVAAPVAVPVVAAAPAAPAPAAPATPAGGVQVTCPMPGMVVSFKVASGATVKKGEAILALEAMKMENDIAASASGVVSFVVAKGANVNTGDVLAIIS